MKILSLCLMIVVVLICTSDVAMAQVQALSDSIKQVEFRQRFLTDRRLFDNGEHPWIGVIGKDNDLWFTSVPSDFDLEPPRVLRYLGGELEEVSTSQKGWPDRLRVGLDSGIARIATLFNAFSVTVGADSNIIVGAGVIAKFDQRLQSWTRVKTQIENTGVRPYHYAAFTSSKGQTFLTCTKRYFKTREPLATSGYVDSTKFQILRVVGDTTLVEYESSVKLFDEIGRIVEDSQGNIYAPGGQVYETVRFAINDVVLSMPSLRKREANGTWSFMPLPERFRTTFWGAFINDITIDDKDNLYLLLRRLDSYSNPLLREPTSGIARINLRTGQYDQTTMPYAPEFARPIRFLVHDKTIFVGTSTRSLRDSLGRSLPSCTGLFRFRGMNAPLEAVGPCVGKPPHFLNSNRRGVGLLHLYGDTLVVGESPLMFFPLQKAKTEIFTSVESAHPAVPYRPIRLFPNPANTTINVRLDEYGGSGPWRIWIADERGQIAYVDDFVRDANVSIDISALPAGRYTLATFSGMEYLGSARFVIQR